MITWLISVLIHFELFKISILIQFEQMKMDQNWNRTRYPEFQHVILTSKNVQVRPWSTRNKFEMTLHVVNPRFESGSIKSRRAEYISDILDGRENH